MKCYVDTYEPLFQEISILAGVIARLCHKEGCFCNCFDSENDSSPGVWKIGRCPIDSERRGFRWVVAGCNGWVASSRNSQQADGQQRRIFVGGLREDEVRRGGRFVGVPGDIANQTVLEFVFEKTWWEELFKFSHPPRPPPARLHRKRSQNTPPANSTSIETDRTLLIAQFPPALSPPSPDNAPLS